MIPLIGTIGPNQSACPPELYEFGIQLGQRLGSMGYTVVCGGMGGWMEAVCRGVKETAQSTHRTIGILPSGVASDANPYIDIVIPTEMGTARNAIIVNAAEVLIAAGGGAGTLSELAFAWQRGKRVLCIVGFGGWSEKLAGQHLDNRTGAHFIPVYSIEEIIHQLKMLLPT